MAGTDDVRFQNLRVSTNSELLSLVHFMVRNEVLDVISISDDECDYIEPSSPPVHTLPDTSNINESHMRLLTQQNRKFPKLPENEYPVLPVLLKYREMSINGCHGFSSCDKFRVNSLFLPNAGKRMAQYKQKVFCGTYSKTGDHFLSASQDAKIRVFDTSNGQFRLLKQICARDVGWSILDTAFCPNEKHVAYSSWSESIHLCRIDGTKNQEHVALHVNPNDRRFCIFSLVFSHDGHEILGGSNDGCLYVYDINCHCLCLKIKCHTVDANAVCFADETSQILFSGGDDGLCKVWDRRTLSEQDPKPVGIFAGHKNGITFIDSRGDGRHLITNSKDQSIKLWDMRRFSSKEAQIKAGHFVATQHWDYRWQKVPKSARLFADPVPGDTSILTYRGHQVLQTLIRARFSPLISTGQRYIYTGCSSGKLIIYDLITGKILQRMDGHVDCVRDAHWHPFNNEIVTSAWDGCIMKWTYGGEFDGLGNPRKLREKMPDYDVMYAFETQSDNV